MTLRLLAATVVASVRPEIRQRLLDILLRLKSADTRGAGGGCFACAVASLRGYISIVFAGVFLTAIVLPVLMGRRGPVVLGMAWSPSWDCGGEIEGSAV